MSASSPAEWAALWARLAPRMQELLALAPAERERRLGALTGTEPDTAASLRQLLALRESGNLASWLAERRGPLPEPAAGDRIGTWRLVEPLPGGSHGRRWRARRCTGLPPVEATLQLMPLPLHDPKDQTRFLQACAALTRLDHPGLARLQEAGLSAHHQPFLVHEPVSGVPIDDWCQVRQLSVRSRVELFLQVVDAVTATHVLGVVHGSLAPENIRVDGHGQVRLLDSGVAGLPVDDTVPAAKLASAGHPAHASPERLLGGPPSITADVFALGVTLFELLTGQHPSGLIAATRSAYLHAGQRGEIRPASERVPALRRELRGDLDKILSRALQGEPAARYASAAALGEDLRRHLGHLPITAGPESLLERLLKLLWRHWPATAFRNRSWGPRPR